MVRINNQYSPPVCIGRRTDAHVTMNDTQEISWENRLLTQEHDMVIWEFVGTGYRVNDVQTIWTDELQMMTSCGSRTSQSHKSIAQINCTKQGDVTSKNGNDE